MPFAVEDLKNERGEPVGVRVAFEWSRTTTNGKSQKLRYLERLMRDIEGHLGWLMENADEIEAGLICNSEEPIILYQLHRTKGHS